MPGTVKNISFDNSKHLAGLIRQFNPNGQPSFMASPRHIDIAITGKCNLRCKTCYYADEMVALRNIPTRKWLRVMDELGKMGVMDVNLSGGEPLSHRDIREIIEQLVNNRMRFSINSNGVLITTELAAFLRDTGRCDVVQVSIDGSCPAVHDHIRGKGAFEGAVRGIRLLQDAGINVTVRVTINRANLHDLPNIFRFLYEELELENVTTNEAFPRGAAQCNIDDLDMCPEERRLAEAYCMDAAARYPALGAQAGPLVLGRHLKEIKRAVVQQNGNAVSLPQGGELSACGAPFSKLAILHDGAVVPCDQLPDMVLGYVGQDSLMDIWRESQGLRYLRVRGKIPLEHLESCKGCKYQRFCTGGCPAIAYAVTGDINARDPRSCYRALLGEDELYSF